MTLMQAAAISSPAAGLIVYTTDDNNWNFFDGTVWRQMSTTSTAHGSYIFNYTGSVQQFQVPLNVTSITVDIQGGQGGGGGDEYNIYSYGGQGGRVQGTIDVTPGEIYYIYVGGVGGDGPNHLSGAPGGWNGGGSSALGAIDYFNTPENLFGGGGGGASDIRFGGNALSNRIAVAGGGGGAGDYGNNQTNGDMGGPGGASNTNTGGGYSDGYQGNIYYQGGMGGTSTGGGAGCNSNGCNTNSGVLGIGGSVCIPSNGGGGGGGYYGGGAGDIWFFSIQYGQDYGGGGGGGGSNYTHNGCNNCGKTINPTSNEGGVRSGAGLVIITW
jgi:hypothetical protein